MIKLNERGMVTAEYTIGTLGAVTLAMVLVKLGLLGIDGPWVGRLWEIVRESLAWRNILSGVPRLGFGFR